MINIINIVKILYMSKLVYNFEFLKIKKLLMPKTNMSTVLCNLYVVLNYISGNH